MKLISIRLVFCLIVNVTLDICGAGTKLYLSKEYGNDIDCLAAEIDCGCLEWDYTTDNNIFVHNDNAFVGLTIIQDNYWCTFNCTIQGYGNNSKQLCILCDNQAEGSNMIDLSTS